MSALFCFYHRITGGPPAGSSSTKTAVQHRYTGTPVPFSFQCELTLFLANIVTYFDRDSYIQAYSLLWLAVCLLAGWLADQPLAFLSNIQKEIELFLF